MNATYNIDHLQAITHATALLNTGVAFGDTAAVSRPKTAASSHYDPTGQEVATTSNTSYEGVMFAADGSITGGNLSHEVSVPGANKLSTTSLGLTANGKPASAQITEHNRNGDGDFKHTQLDMSGATWNESLAISAGQVKLTTVDAATGQKKHDGIILFNNEVIESGAFTHYATDGSNAVTGASQVDYSGAKFLGVTIVGGQYTVRSHTADNVLKSTSLVSVSPLGRVQSIETSNMSGGGASAATGAVSTKVSVDFSKVLFNARNEFDSGEVAYATTDGSGNLLSKTTVAYNNANPSLSTTLAYKDGQLQSKTVIDYAASRFNNEQRVVNSTKKVDTYDGNGKLLASNIIAYDAQGTKVTGSAAAAIKAAAPPKVTQPLLKVQVKNSFKNPVQGSGSGVPPQVENFNRADGTLREQRETYLNDNLKPISIVLIFYAADGTTIVKKHTIDLSSLDYNETTKTVSGTLNMQSHTGGNILHSESSIQY